jgi:hypothetical protein
MSALKNFVIAQTQTIPETFLGVGYTRFSIMSATTSPTRAFRSKPRTRRLQPARPTGWRSAGSSSRTRICRSASRSGPRSTRRLTAPSARHDAG